MHRPITFVTALAILIATPTLTFAQATKGDKELFVSGNVSTKFSPSPFGGNSTSSSGNAFFGLGVFVTDRTQIGVSPFISIGSNGDGGVDADLGMSTHFQYYMGAQSAKVKPYVGYSLLISSFKTTNGGSIANNMYNAAQFGVKNYFSERAALDLNASYGFAVKNVEAQNLDFRIGISYLF